MWPTRFLNGILLLIFASFLIVLVSFGVASANTITVTNTNDSGAGSLRQAMQQAMIDAPGDVIDITATGTILLQSPLLPINRNLTIKGPGAASLTVSGAGSYQVFNIGLGATVDISGLTVSNGFISGAGGGIFNLGTLTLRDCTVSGNEASSATNAAQGGGIYNEGTLTLRDCTVSGNEASSATNAAQGGGIFNGIDGTLEVTHCTVSGNSVSTTSGTALGGGIYNEGTLTLTDSTVSGNTATAGGGIFSEGIFVESTLTVTNCTFSDNTATTTGGGILGMGTLTVTNCTFSGNTANVGDGGGIFVEGTLTVTNCTFSGNSAAFGGGLFNGGGTPTSPISGNNPTDTYFPSDGITVGTSTMTNCTFSDNTATTTGGGIYNGTLEVGLASGDNQPLPGPAPVLDVENTIVANNSGGNCWGAGITSLGYNLEYPAPTTCGFTATGDIVGQDPKLGPLALNLPGTTETFALLAGSPAIDAADPNNFPPTDQRGVIRPQEAGPDIGAYEYAPPTAVPAMDGWGIIVFIILAGFGSVYYLRRRGRAEG